MNTSITNQQVVKYSVNKFKVMPVSQEIIIRVFTMEHITVLGLQRGGNKGRKSVSQIPIIQNNLYEKFQD